MDISKIDKNFVIKTEIDREDLKFYSIDESPFKVYGIFKENGKYRRMPEDVAESVSKNVYWLHDNTAGGRVRFVTDSNYIALNATLVNCVKGPHFPVTGTCGFDLYVNNHYNRTFVPPFDVEDSFERVIDFESNELREITINFPLYSGVKEVYIGLQESAVVKEALPYKNSEPVVYYGSSITQGGCASRPGTSYQSHVSRRFNCDYINLGFSGSARGELEMAEYVSKLDMSVFVYDYDYNAVTLDELETTHERMFKMVRNAHPDIPIIMMSRPKYYLTDEELKRVDIIKTTYNNALASGDKNVYLITGPELSADCKDEGTVDGVHPNDFGFASMAKALGDVMEKINCI